jgi:transcriptional regulator with XRE-family HTH domain
MQRIGGIVIDTPLRHRLELSMPLLGERLRLLRERKGWTQPDMADKLSVKYQQYSTWERGKADPSTDVLARMATALSCTSDYLLGLVDEPHLRLEEDKLPPDERNLLRLYRQRRIPRAVRQLLGDPDLFKDQPEAPQIESGNQGTVAG